MDVGITSSTKERALHLLTGCVVVAIGYSAAIFALRVLILG